MCRRTIRRRCRRAFTLLEIIVVVTIIAMLAALVAPRILVNVDKSKWRIAQAESATIAEQVRLWMLDHGKSSLPDDFDLSTLLSGKDPYLGSDDLVDPWERPYVLVNPGDRNVDFDIVSWGADGALGGEGLAADIIR